MTNGEKFKEVFKDTIADVGYDGLTTITKVSIFHNHYVLYFLKGWWNAEYEEPTPKNDLGVDCISRAELLKAMDTWDKFGNDPNEGLIPLRTPALQDRYVPYVHYDDMVNCVKGMPSVTPIRPNCGVESER